MNVQKYEKFYKYISLNNFKNQNYKKFGIDEETALIILRQKIIRNTKKRYFVIKNQNEKLFSIWKRGENLTSIAKKLNYSPVITANIILSKIITKKVWRKYLRDPESIHDERLKKEFKEVIDNDIVYSPNAIIAQQINGKLVELNVKKWLLKHNIEFNDNYKHSNLSPDFYISNGMKIDNINIMWIECKARYGDFEQINENWKQISAYMNNFGTGMVVYWYGYIDKIKCPGIVLQDKNYFYYEE